MTTQLVISDDLPRLTGPCRMTVFATRDVPVGKRGGVKRVGVGWYGWNADPVMEAAMSRLPGQGSFYWPGALAAYVAAKAMLRTDTRIHQIKLETISGREIGRIYV